MKGRERRQQAARERVAARALGGSLISLAALLGTTVDDPEDRPVGRLADVVVRWKQPETYPSVSSIVVHTGHSDLVVGAHWVTISAPNAVRLRSGAAYVRAAERHPAEIALAHDVLDRQVVDAEGMQIVRPSDVYLARVDDRIELIGIEIGPGALLRRLGPKRLRSRLRPQRVIDWTAIQGFAAARSDGLSSNDHGPDLAGRTGAGLVLDASGCDVRRLHPSEVQAALEAAQKASTEASR